MWIRTKDGWYVHEIKGVCYITWVSEDDRENALHFPSLRTMAFLALLRNWTSKDLEAVNEFSEAKD